MSDYRCCVIIPRREYSEGGGEIHNNNNNNNKKKQKRKRNAQVYTTTNDLLVYKKYVRDTLENCVTRRNDNHTYQITPRWDVRLSFCVIIPRREYSEGGGEIHNKTIHISLVFR